MALTPAGADQDISRAAVVHQEKDDLETQPTGDAGPRVGCGTTGIAGPPESIPVARPLLASRQPPPPGVSRPQTPVTPTLW